MTGLFLTKNATPILGQFAAVLGWIINGIFNFLDSIGIPNVGLTVVLFTVIIYTLMLPLTYKQQKFSRMSVKMNPELQAIQKKYKGKQDQVSMLKMQDEMKAVYAKYGTSQMGSCLPLLIQLPFLLAVYRVVYAIPAYVDKVRAVYTPLVSQLVNIEGAQDVLTKLSSAAQFSRQAFNENTIIDILNKASTAEWDTVASSFPDLSGVIDQTRNALESINGFLGLNISNSPWFSIKQFWAEGAYLLLIVALLIPVLAGLTQWISVRLMPTAAPATGDGNSEDMMKSMRMMNNFMPLMSVWFCFVLPVGVGIYWVMSAVVRMVQQLAINKYLSKMDIDEEIKKNIEKYNRKREKDGLPPERLNNVARTSAKSVEPKNTKKREITSEDRMKQIKDSTEYYKKGEAKPGSLAAKARMVEQYNEKTKKK
ncbi:stage III sporulation protein J [Lachnoclostridium sp. An131]|uniref:YidC/Oxa1 family membrane protein insertase n=1 Tax=Lachnoclostridium sp. An131 TaxID=1965555 RepID=UPI000B36C1FE|nr:YidC/Oxa1 family membrane protein insertase [Lachnoclostridium sp. An131]OUQ28123.1 stage III sporulation protein J [Lachnoclostridium sp. An131]